MIIVHLFLIEVLDASIIYLLDNLSWQIELSFYFNIPYELTAKGRFSS